MTIKYLSIVQLEKIYRDITGELKVTYNYKGGIQFILDNVWNLYDDLDEKDAIVGKASYLWHTIASNQWYTNGNKRMGWHVGELMLSINGWQLNMLEDDKFAWSHLIATKHFEIDHVRQLMLKNLIKEDYDIK